LKLLGLLLVITVFLLGGVADGAGLTKPAERSPGAGKTFLFIAKQFGIPAVKASIRLREKPSDQGKRSYQIEARVESLNFGFFFRMNNHFTSTMDAETCRPIQYVREIDQGGLFIKDKKYVEAASFDSILRKVVLERKGAPERKEIPLPADTYDPLSMFARWYLKEELHPGRDVSMSVFDGVKVRQLVFHVERDHVASTLLGEVGAVRLESTTPFSSFGEKEGTIRIWYTADERKIPVVMELDLPAGSMRFDLTAIEENE
jgi:hypothetical protein